MEEEKKQLEQELLKHKSEVSELMKETIQRKDLEEEFTCSICQGLMVQATAVPSCGHSFCAQCIEDWLMLKKVWRALLSLSLSFPPHAYQLICLPSNEKRRVLFAETQQRSPSTHVTWITLLKKLLRNSYLRSVYTCHSFCMLCVLTDNNLCNLAGKNRMASSKGKAR